ncbi:hypothetical protein [Paraburkholderia silvatlantica]|uniref:hypothetical protein n=1 Tax=Paraburkholderia silvatlantica TaxID=321895 RepID=UPI00105B3EF7|nr:hypothetical protein [Paraburkholderia silvatlantica]TDQ83478.1 hypothetical protein C7412_12214 [Paraburkholderia silvatlantica]
MTNTKRTASLDEVLADYANASPEFDAKVLRTFVEQYPEHAGALQRYAQVQLTSVAATADEVENEPLSDEEMLPLQSKLLQRMQQLRGAPSASDLQQASSKLASISGEKATQAAAAAVFGSSEHGEDLLLLSITESASGAQHVPDWFYEELGSHLSLSATVIQASLGSRLQPTGLQRFSTRGKPAESPPVTWEQAVEDCITDDAVKRAILERSSRT